MAEGFHVELENLAETVPVLRAMGRDLTKAKQGLVGSDIIIGPVYTHLESALVQYAECRDAIAEQIVRAHAAVDATADALDDIVEVYSRADGQG